MFGVVENKISWKITTGVEELKQINIAFNSVFMKWFIVTYSLKRCIEKISN